MPSHGFAGSKAGAPDTSGPESAGSAKSYRDLWASLLLGIALVAPRAQAQQAANGDLVLRAQRAATVLTNHQQAPGYWLTYYTDKARFERPRPEMNTFVTSVIIDLVNPVAGAAGLEKSLQRARNHLAGQIEEAKAYLAHPLLGPRLLECAEAVLHIEGRSAREIFGSPDDLKLRSCATLFACVLPPGSVFDRLLTKYYGGGRDEKTLQLLGITLAGK